MNCSSGKQSHPKLQCLSYYIISNTPVESYHRTLTSRSYPAVGKGAEAGWAGAGRSGQQALCLLSPRLQDPEAILGVP